ncbi:hypothetical protein CTI12_AA006290 [Artemisia annua]|uniref:Neprosin PEP catalytic domain-containing protein n=1 Tax=Artemisia annua TaxID=35608 RepID=A0A2U1QNJ6_ARTAN|nr:hypothetical protein CTI12_AA006290 [Artemisia annua]
MAHAHVSTSRGLKGVLLLVFLFVDLGLLSCAARVEKVTRQKMQVNKHLKRLNKKPVKTIESPDGDKIDCVHISHQPAFDHPFLKDHKIQMRPNFHPEGLYDDNKMNTESKGKENTMHQLWHVNGMCPEDTIPIRRTKEDDVLRASSVKTYGKKHHKSVPVPRNVNIPKSADPDIDNESGHQHAIAYVEGDKYYGAKATMNVWEPKIQQSNEFSLSQIWILGGSFGQDLNSIEAGWQVSPDLYGDNNTRLFTYWTSDAYQATGCYNLLCSGFIQINSNIAMGASISPVSGFRNSQYDISILVWKSHVYFRESDAYLR